MPLSAAQKSAIEEVIDAITVEKAPGRSKRVLSDMFLELVDRDDWPEYYQLISEPRSINLVKHNLQRNKYKDTFTVFKDLNLVFTNALFYNEEGSQIVKDATVLKDLLHSEWKKQTILQLSPLEEPQLPSTKPSSPPKPPATEPKTTRASAAAAKQSSPTKPSSTPSTTVAVEVPATQKSASASATSAAANAAPAQTTPAPPRASSAEMDVDIERGTPDHDEPIEDSARDAESDSIVQQLEKSLPRWEGYGSGGWMSEPPSEDRYLEIVQAIKSHKDVIGNRVAIALDSLSELSPIETLSFNFPLSLKIIEANVRNKIYKSAMEFDRDFIRLFEKGRRSYDIGSEMYGNVLLLQRLYQAITSSSPPSGPPYLSHINFASLRAGPGTARPLHAASENDGAPGVTTFRVSNKDRHFVDEVEYKGWSMRLGDWLHLANPDDPSRPIVAQVFKCWISDESSRKGQPGVTACWYYRPEQTFHTAQRQFWENEVFKTSHFADHPLEDIIEKIACQFTARHIRGRPRPPYYYPGWPLYVCDSRYNDRERVFVRIKNWNSCVPEEVRKSLEFMPIYPFERTVFPLRYVSPFLGRYKGSRGKSFPGGILEGGQVDQLEKVDLGGNSRKRVRKSAAGPGGSVTPRVGRDDVGPSRGMFVGNAAGVLPVQAHTHYTAAPTYAIPTVGTSKRDRSLVTAAGGAAGLGANFHVSKLPSETTRHFDRDPENNELLWFSGPPLDIARKREPQYSLEYLHYLTKKRKLAGEASAAHIDKEPKPELHTTSEIFNNLWTQYFGDEPEYLPS